MSRLNTMYPDDEFLKNISDIMGKLDNKNEREIKQEIEQIGYKEFYRYYKEKDVYIKQLQQENQELKLELSGYRQAILEDKDMLGLKEENTELKKQLEEYKLITIDYQELEARNQELKKQLEEKENIACNWKDSCLENAGKIEKLETQQKEFIEYMNKTIEELECDDVGDEELKGYLIQRIDTFKEILQKYKEIIGDDK